MCVYSFRGTQVLVQCRKLSFGLGNIEPLFCTLSLYDLRNKCRVSEVSTQSCTHTCTHYSASRFIPLHWSLCVRIVLICHTLRWSSLCIRKNHGVKIGKLQAVGLRCFHTVKAWLHVCILTLADASFSLGWCPFSHLRASTSI